MTGDGYFVPKSDLLLLLTSLQVFAIRLAATSANQTAGTLLCYVALEYCTGMALPLWHRLDGMLSVWFYKFYHHIMYLR